MKMKTQDKTPARFVAVSALLLLCFAHARGQTSPRVDELKRKIETVISASGAETVGVAFYDLETKRELLVNPDASFHAASTMKVPVMMEVFRQAREGKLSLDAGVVVRNEFKSIADGSPFSVSPEDDSERTLYRKVGRSVPVRELIELMINVSSNLATNVLIERVTPARVMDLMRQTGAHNIRVLRGVEDGKAYERGLNNVTTAADLATIMTAIERGEAVSARAAREMRDILMRQEFNDAIPAGLPPGTPVAFEAAYGWGGWSSCWRNWSWSRTWSIPAAARRSPRPG